MGTSGARIGRRDVLALAEALGVKWNTRDSMPVLFVKLVEEARRKRARLERQDSHSGRRPRGAHEIERIT